MQTSLPDHISKYDYNLITALIAAYIGIVINNNLTNHSYKLSISYPMPCMSASTECYYNCTV